MDHSQTSGLSEIRLVLFNGKGRTSQKFMMVLLVGVSRYNSRNSKKPLIKIQSLSGGRSAEIFILRREKTQVNDIKHNMENN